MPEYTIELEIKDGKVHATVKGVAGPKCGELSKFLDQLGEVEKDEQTPDFQKRVTTTAGSRLKGG